MKPGWRPRVAAREQEAASLAAALTAGLVSVERIIGDAVGRLLATVS